TNTPVHALDVYLVQPFRRPPPSTLFPYTTLFRSVRRYSASTRRRAADAPSSACAPPLCRSPAGPVAPIKAGGIWRAAMRRPIWRSEEHTSELQSRENLVCRLLLEKKNHNHAG